MVTGVVKDEFQPDNQQVDVLLLAFDYSDIGELLKEQRCKVRDAFKGKGLQVKNLTIDMTEPWEGWLGLGAKLRIFLSGRGNVRIIYYQGHGRETKDNKLELMSHDSPGNFQRLQDAKKFWAALQDTSLSQDDRQKIADKHKYYQKEAVVPWDRIGNLVMEAERDVLVILDCCSSSVTTLQADHKKLAAALSRPTDTPGAEASQYAKEAIVATVWNSKIYDEMSNALCGSLNKWDLGKAPELPAERLCLDMRDILDEKRPGRKTNIEDKKKNLAELEERAGTSRAKKADSKDITQLKSDLKELSDRLEKVKLPHLYLLQQSVNKYRRRLRIAGTPPKQKTGNRRNSFS